MNSDVANEKVKDSSLAGANDFIHFLTPPGDLAETQASIQEVFCGIEMFCHWEDLIKQLNHVPANLEHHNSTQAEEQCMELKRVLLEVDEEAVNALTRKPPTFIPFELLTPTNTHRIPSDLHMCPPMSMISHSENLRLLPTTNHLTCTSDVFPHSSCCPFSLSRQWMSQGILIIVMALILVFWAKFHVILT